MLKIISKEWVQFFPTGGSNRVEIICDGADDIANLPTEDICPGSVAVIATEGLPMYVLNASGSWVGV